MALDYLAETGWVRTAFARRDPGDRPMRSILPCWPKGDRDVTDIIDASANGLC